MRAVITRWAAKDDTPSFEATARTRTSSGGWSALGAPSVR
jgi:hypothetical protein